MSEQRRCSIAILPCNLGQQWVLAVLFFDKEVIGVYDSFGAERVDISKKLEKWANLSFSSGARWSFGHLREMKNSIKPNPVDCGVHRALHIYVQGC